MDYVTGTNIEKTDKWNTTLNIKRGEYRLIIDGSALFGPRGQIFRPIPGETNVILTLYNSSEVVQPGGGVATETTARVLVNDSINTFRRVVLEFFVPTNQIKAVLEFKSDRDISGAIFEKNKVSSVDFALIISIFRLVPYSGMALIFLYGLYVLTMKVLERANIDRMMFFKKKVQ